MLPKRKVKTIVKKKKSKNKGGGMRKEIARVCIPVLQKSFHPCPGRKNMTVEGQKEKRPGNVKAKIPTDVQE